MAASLLCSMRSPRGSCMDDETTSSTEGAVAPLIGALIVGAAKAFAPVLHCKGRTPKTSLRSALPNGVNPSDGTRKAPRIEGRLRLTP